MLLPSFACFFSFSFFFNDTATTEIYTLSLHDALPIYRRHAELMRCLQIVRQVVEHCGALRHRAAGPREALIGLLCRLGVDIFERMDVEDVVEAAENAKPRRNRLGMFARAVGEDEFPPRQCIDRGTKLGCRSDGAEIDVVDI